MTDLSCFPPLPSFPLRTTARSLFSPAQKQRKENKEKGANIKRCRRMGWGEVGKTRAVGSAKGGISLCDNNNNGYLGHLTRTGSMRLQIL